MRQQARKIKTAIAITHPDTAVESFMKGDRLVVRE